MSHISARQEQIILTTYAREGTLRAAAEAAGVNPRTVPRVLERNGVKQRRGRVLVDPETSRAVLSLYAAGASKLEVGRELNISAPTVGKVLVQAGVCVDSGRQHSRGPDHWGWRGGRYVTKDGYVKVWVAHDDLMSAMADRQGRVFEHRLVMARALGRVLTRHETVHHIDGDRQNNGLLNLQLRHGKHGTGVVMCCRECGSTNVAPATI